jgi:hypothetical protein
MVSFIDFLAFSARVAMNHGTRITSTNHFLSKNIMTLASRLETFQEIE